MQPLVKEEPTPEYYSNMEQEDPLVRQVKLEPIEEVMLPLPEVEWSIGMESSNRSLKREHLAENLPVRIIKQEFPDDTEEDDRVYDVSASVVEPKVEFTIDNHIIDTVEGPNESLTYSPKTDKSGLDTSNLAKATESSVLCEGEIEGCYLDASKTHEESDLTNNKCKKIQKILECSINECMPSNTSNICVASHLRRYMLQDHSNVDYCKISLSNQGHIPYNDSKRVKCEECGKCFKLVSELRRHLKTHSDEKVYNCVECGRCFARCSDLKKHLRIHSGKKDFKCEVCGTYFTENSNLKKHVMIHTGIKNYRCEACEKCFTRASYLRRHLKIHTGKKDHKCEGCGTSFTEKSNLKKHLMIHTGIKKYKCEECGKCFSMDSDLKRHLRIHSGKKDYKCDECDMDFTEKSNLKKHVMLHSGVRNYKCEKCAKRFSTDSDLKRHLRIHYDKKDYKCDECGIYFTAKSNLKKHAMIHAGIYKCKECGKCFSTDNDLKSHSRIHTGIGL